MEPQESEEPLLLAPNLDQKREVHTTKADVLFISRNIEQSESSTGEARTTQATDNRAFAESHTKGLMNEELLKQAESLVNPEIRPRRIPIKNLRGADNQQGYAIRVVNKTELTNEPGVHFKHRNARVHTPLEALFLGRTYTFLDQFYKTLTEYVPGTDREELSRRFGAIKSGSNNTTIYDQWEIDVIRTTREGS